MNPEGPKVMPANVSPSPSLGVPRGTVETVPPAADTRKRRRRPSGEKPPLPRELHRSGRYWLALFAVVFVAWLVIFVVQGAGQVGTRFDMAILEYLTRFRTPTMTSVMRTIDALGSDWTFRILRWTVLLTLLVVKRFRHLFVFFGSILLVGFITTFASIGIQRPRPLGIPILGHWQGFSHPSLPMAALAVTLIGICYTLVSPGRPRTIAKWVTVALLVVFASARMYLGVDHPTDLIVATILGVAIPLVAFRMLTPNDVFPVTYKRGRTAHLDVSGDRGVAIRKALEEQLGITIVTMKPFGLEGSGGSTPLRLTVDDPENPHLFAKLYASNHLRADRWYKLGRTLLYGRLEDETAFSTVRRLVQYEDYMLRVMRDAGLMTPKPYGFAEITPEREYVIVTDFVHDSEEILKAEVDDQIIDAALQTVRTLWDAGLAHRDIKPSNILVRKQEVFLIDVAFAEIRPSPWRQAVDLANMMLVLAIRSDPDRVYERALRFFTADEIAEAFAATHGVTIPSQSRDLIKKDRGRLLTRFRELAPRRRKISIQRWSVRRVGLTMAVFVAGLVAVMVTLGNLQGAGLL